MGSKKVKLKKGIFQKMFWLISIIFLLIIIIIYGIRLINSFNLYNDDMKIYEYTIKNSDIVKDDNEYSFKGEETNNYIKYNGIMFRIVKIYKDGSMDLVTDNSINSLLYDDNEYEFINSSVLEYLNSYFIKYLDKDDLNKSPICLDRIDDINNITCSKIDFNNYVRLLSVSEYMNTYLDNKSYLGSNMLLSSYSNDSIYVGVDGKLYQSNIDKFYDIYPVITIKNTIKYTSGDGTKDNPFIIRSTKYDIGSYVKIEDDMYTIIESNGNNIKLMLSDNNFIVRSKLEEDYIKELNTEYYNSLSYRDILEKYKLNVSMYDGSISNKEETVYVGIPSLYDIKIDNSISDYYLSNTYNKYNLYYNNGVFVNDNNYSLKIRIVISIKKNIIKSGNGTYKEPYIVEVK